MNLRAYLKHLLIGEAVVLDEGLCVIVFPHGDAHLTVSATCGSQYAVKKPCLFCRLVCGFIQSILGRFWPRLKTHCANSWAAERTAYLSTKNLPGG